MNVKEALRKAKEQKIKFVQLQFTDLHGIIKAVTIPARKLADSFEKGTWFDGSSIEGFTRIQESDMYLKPDPKTYALLPWEKVPTARVICDVYMPDGKPFEGDPRYILRKVLSEAKKLGFEYNVGPELEFFLFKKNDSLEPVTHDVAGYFDFSPRDLAGDVRNEIIAAVEAMNIEVEMSHHEVGPGQHEIDFKYGEALTQADRCITFKHAVKSIANNHDLYATFMPKPVFGENGSGMHVHQSMFNMKTGKNVFFDAKDPYKLSKVAKSFVAGQLKHIKAVCSVIAPTVNSYKRLVPGYEAPVYICWAQRNRSALIRIPRYSPGREQSTRCELRCPDPSCNPYLAFAVMLKAGLDGIKNKMQAPKPTEENVYEYDAAKLKTKNIDTLPESMGDAIKALEKDAVIGEALGAHTLPVYIHAKKSEWQDYRLQISKWELDRYFETI